MFETVKLFENKIAEYFGAPYCISTDSCTHAIELCLRYTKQKVLSVPRHTYISVPFTLIKLDNPVVWEDNPWQDFYTLSGTDIIDAACYWKQNGYIHDSFMCLSFQYKKHLKLGRGGAILCSYKDDYEILSAMRYDGRNILLPWAQQDIKIVGYHYYMTPENAAEGIQKFNEVKDLPPRKFTYKDYPDLSLMSVFNE